MEVSESPSTTLPPLNTSTATGTRQSSRRTPTSSPKRIVVRENKLKGTPPRSTPVSGKESVTTRSRAKSTRLAPGAARPIVPLTERRTHEDRDKSPTNYTSETSELRWEVAPDGGSAGREGRQFTVSNVGNNGRIYLRYVLKLRITRIRHWKPYPGSTRLRHSAMLTGLYLVSMRPQNNFTETSQASGSSRPPETPTARLRLPRYSPKYGRPRSPRQPTKTRRGNQQ